MTRIRNLSKSILAIAAFVFTSISLSGCSNTEELVDGTPPCDFNYQQDIDWSVLDIAGNIAIIKTMTSQGTIYTDYGASAIKIAFHDCYVDVPHIAITTTIDNEQEEISDTQWRVSDKERGVTVNVTKYVDAEKGPGFIAEFIIEPIDSEDQFTCTNFGLIIYDSEDECRKEYLHIERERGWVLHGDPIRID